SPRWRRHGRARRVAPARAEGRNRARRAEGARRPGGRPGAHAGAPADRRPRNREPGPAPSRGVGPRAGPGAGQPARLSGARRGGGFVTGPKSAVRVTIGGEEYSVRSELPPEYTREVAAYLDAALKRVRDMLPTVEAHKAAILAGL